MDDNYAIQDKLERYFSAGVEEYNSASKRRGEPNTIRVGFGPAIDGDYERSMQQQSGILEIESRQDGPIEFWMRRTGDSDTYGYGQIRLWSEVSTFVFPTDPQLVYNLMQGIDDAELCLQPRMQNGTKSITVYGVRVWAMLTRDANAVARDLRLILSNLLMARHFVEEFAAGSCCDHWSNDLAS